MEFIFIPWEYRSRIKLSRFHSSELIERRPFFWNPVEKDFESIPRKYLKEGKGFGMEMGKRKRVVFVVCLLNLCLLVVYLLYFV